MSVHGESKSSASELDQIRSDLATLKRSLELDSGALSAARSKSFEVERRIDETSAKLGVVDKGIKVKNSRISTLREQRTALEHDMRESRALLDRNAVARYALVTQPPMKLLLSQDKVRSMSRHLAYNEYVMRAYSRDFKTLAERAKAVADTESALKLETNALRRLRSENEHLLATLTLMRDEHASLIGAIEKRLADGNNRVAQLREDERHLLELVRQLAPAKVPNIARASFATLKGDLAWPAAGRLVKAPGSALRAGGAQWAGVFIDSKPGAAVTAVAAGEVVFADWFRNLGKLIILDHGNGYMTLYGNNAEVHKKAGDRVSAGDTIATVGAGSGEMPAGVYFELRERGQPLDPRLWCAKR